MDPSAILLIAAGIAILISGITYGASNSTDLKTKDSVETLEKRERRHENVRKWSTRIAIVLVLTAIAVFIIPRWDKLQNAQQKETTHSGLMLHQPFFYQMHFLSFG